MIGVLFAINPHWCELILNGEKTVEIRKTIPKLPPPFTGYIYCTKPKYDHEDFIVVGSGTPNARAFYAGGKVVGEFVCDGIAAIKYEEYDEPSENSEAGFYQWWDSIEDWTMRIGNGACMTHKQWHDYLGKKGGYGLSLTRVKPYEEPKKLAEFYKPACDRVNDCGNCALFDRANFDCSRIPILRRPPQSWCYVEALT